MMFIDYFILPLGGLLILLLLGILIFQIRAKRKGAPFVPSGKSAQEKALALLKLQPGETFMDLGCGDGRVVFYAINTYQVRGYGYEQSQILLLFARLKNLFYGTKATFFHGELGKKTPLHYADAYFIFLMPHALSALAPYFSSLPGGTRIVTNVFPIIHPKILEMEKVEDDSFSSRQHLYLYLVQE